MAHPNITDQLGGAKAVADALRARGVIVADVTVRSWTLAGRTVPAKYWTHLVAIGASVNVAVSFEQLAQAAAQRAPMDAAA